MLLMDRKGKATALFCLIAVILLGLYRNFGVPVLRFWPLILLDTVLRIPGDNLLNLLAPRLPDWIYEFLRGLFQAVTILLLGVGFMKFRAFLRGRPRVEIPPTGRPELPQPDAKPRRRWLTVAGWTAFALLLLNGRCGRGVVSAVSFLCGVQGYPLLVSTEVFLEGPEHKATVDNYSFHVSHSEQLSSGSNEDHMSVALQDDLLSRQKVKIPLLRPGKLRFRDTLPDVSLDEAKAVERRALAFLNAFEDMYWRYRADASLAFSEDGKHAAYRIEISYYEGPLAAAGFDYAAELVKIGADWIVTSFGSTGSWLS